MKKNIIHNGKFVISNGKFVQGDIKDYISKLFNKDTVVNGDSLPPGFMIWGTNSFEDATRKYLFLSGENIIGDGNGALYIYDINTNTGLHLTNINTGVGDVNEINGEAFPLDGRSYISRFNSITNKVYVGTENTLWEYDLLTNTGYTVYYGVNTRIRDIHILEPEQKIWVATSLSSYYWLWDLSDYSYINNIGNPVASGDNPPTGGRIDNCAFNSTETILLSTFAASGLYIYDRINNTGKYLTSVNTAVSGSYEVIGDPLPSDNIEKVGWITNGIDEIAVSGIWSSSPTTGGIWLYNETTNTGTHLSTSTTNVGGAHEVIGDPLPGNNIIYSITINDNIVYAGTSGGFWLYDIMTNTGKTLSVVSTSPGGDNEVSGPAIPSNNTQDTYVSLAQRVNGIDYFPNNDVYALWTYRKS